ncbi:peroxiredoxin [Idiomarina fontislapidosi]|uniref:TlpA family protein disulfide reductase n=1 Tax=Idiomarina fontislapidosi TaxID=263723 RepID=A0A432Y9A3_9GAMM|nr:TlpA disulfide reductase family protein [Idiomarina fontislapidosi]PYE34530.1 peroxiredoxin [Idiomarina fontislapidosi]RUO57513.1 TlpA family protein disulfide reductase [Idiomarina fontislapidosi]|tara:strand:- start:2669 stop:3136 length:468 start_codon:yes stop_codon:yes gene_type:complete
MKLSLLIASLVTLGVTACSKAPDIQLNNGSDIDWQAAQGTTVVVNYFAEWCAPCLRELPELNEFHHDVVMNDSELTLIGISFDPMNNEQIQALADKHDIEFPLALSQPAPKLPFDRPKMLPATYIVGPDGEVTGPLLGEQTQATLNKAVAEARSE